MMSQDTHEERSLQEDFGWELAQLRQESEALPAELQSIEARLREAQRAPPQWSAVSWGFPTLAVGAAAAVVLAVWASWPRTPAETALDLASQEWVATQVHEDVQLHFEGTGHLVARDRTHQIDWRQGHIQVSVTPKQGIALSVKTEEALVSVVGTVFDVTRDRYGTTVRVEEGRVKVDCVGRDTLYLTPGDGPHTCMTRDPNALVERTREQLEAGDRAGALATSAEGLTVAEAASYPAAQLHTYRAELLLESDTPAALREAEAALASGQPALELRARRAAVAAALRGAGGCAVAEPHLSTLVQDAASPGFHELALLADCVHERRPAEARDLWQRALAAATDDAQREDVHRRLSELE